MEEPKVLELRLAIDPNNFETLFSDAIQVESDADRVILNFLQRLPGDAPEQPNAKIISRIALTWPHYARLVTAINSVMENGREQAKEQFMRNVCPEENVEK